MKTYSIRVILIVLFCLIGFSSEAQIFHKEDESVFPFRVSLAYNAINESPGSPTRLVSGEGWNIQSYPSRIGIERIVYGDLSIEGAFSHNEYLPGKLVNRKIIPNKILNNSYDLNLKYSLRNLFGGGNPYKGTFISHFDPYVSLGAGYTHIEGKNYMPGKKYLNSEEYNYVFAIVGGGMVYWFSKDDEFFYNSAMDRIGIMAQAQAKINPDNDLLQLSLGLIYKFK